MDYRYLRYIFGGSNQKMSSGGVPGGAPTKIINVGASCKNNHGMNHTASHQENACNNAVVERAAKKKRESRIIGGGLRQFSVIVCQKLQSKVRTTYNQVADEIIADFAGTQSDTVVPLESDEKNIRRRVYDALNVLMAMDIIARDKKEIWWKGLPETNMKDLEELKALRVEMMNRIGKKVAYMKDIEEQIVGLQNLMARNRQLLECGSASPEGRFSLPFLLVQTTPHATVEIEISEDMQLVHFDFNSSPFSLHDDAYVLKMMRYNQQPECRDVSPSSFVQSSSSSGTSQGTKPFHWNSETHSEMNIYWKA
ncbi:transcription factor-like protein DPA isoform X1 [Quercus suber]|uniref:transcription factor-like protein DPA isoform X1 n=2 Tax=Quercus suber TaxID=58331 RepID=UPI0032DF3923